MQKVSIRFSRKCYERLLLNNQNRSQRSRCPLNNKLGAQNALYVSGMSVHMLKICFSYISISILDRLWKRRVSQAAVLEGRHLNTEEIILKEEENHRIEDT